MKTMKKSILFLITILLGIISVTSAQTSEDRQRDRDIKIAEGILTEIFGEEGSGDIVFPGFENRSVRGEYIPGYGVHFTVSPGSSAFVIHGLRLGDDEDVRVEFSGDDDSSESSGDATQAAEEKIIEYMTRYASLISGVPDDETVRVTYAPNRTSSVRWVFVGDDNHTQKTLSGVSVWAQMGDLKAFQDGDISEQQLMNRIDTHMLDEEETYKDFNVFASVLETALNSVDTEYLRVNRKPQMEYLPGLGVRYRVQVTTRPSVILNEISIQDGNFEFRMDSLRFNLDESLKLMEESLNPLILKLDSVIDLELTEEEREEMRSELREQRREIRIQQDSLRSSMPLPAPISPHARVDSVELEPEADAIMDELLSVIETYGSTLSSLGNDEMLMISVNWSGRSDALPERTEVRIKKSDLLNGQEPEINEIERR
ncbi:hypothetical protein [Rhodohalobacter sulfatireducens]|uniref:DUF4403 family protein n=1 Tax=Rhodohalobacter sulfatireducens TaxID=2911366 RepID=A0ABS9K9Y7_9BACT|nr:hypothetical protein [Rhodohalobacter sulfatireducens]MCG2587668.1 hypothetical protein [Rhodohalobacter sulfatireducens]